MKIGLISINMYSKNLNFACPLHNYAFQQYLLKKGIQSTIIDYVPNYFDNFNLRNPVEYYTKKIKIWENKYERALKSGDEKEISLIVEKMRLHTERMKAFTRLKHEREIRYDKFQSFIDEKYIKTSEKYDSSLLEVEDPEFDCYICVTDAIWKKEPVVGYEPGFFLASTCMENKWKISYAASTYFTENADDVDLTRRWISDIDFISVRESFLRERLEKQVCPNVSHVLDPVLLHDSEFYEPLIVEPQETNYLLLYYVMNQNPDIIQCALKYAKVHNLKIVELSDQPMESNSIQDSGVEVIYRYDVGVEEWLGYIKYANCIFTNSFHACCFSVLFQKVLFAERRKYDKVGDLLKCFGLSEFLVDTNNFSEYYTPEVDWEFAQQQLLVRRNESENFILNAIDYASQNVRPVHDYMKIKQQQEFPLFYSSGNGKCSLTDNLADNYNENLGEVFKRSKTIEFSPKEKMIKNDGSGTFHFNIFKADNSKFIGWKLRFRIGGRTFYVLEDDKVIEVSHYDLKKHGPCKIFGENSSIPVLPYKGIKNCVAIAQWETNISLYTKIKNRVKRLFA